MAQKVLGRGLDALLGNNSAQVPAETVPVPEVLATAPSADTARSTLVSVSEVDIDKIEPNPFQPRLSFNDETLEELADSIRNLGIIQPLTLRNLPDGKYQIISGERRYRASLRAGLKTVPAYIRKADDVAMLEMAIVENVQREDLDAIDTALGFQRLIDECSLTQEAMALRVGKKRATITNYLRLLKLPPEVQKAVKDGSLSAGHARTLLALEDSDVQIRLCRMCVRYGWSVRALEDKVKRLTQEEEEKPAKTTPGANLTRLAEIVGNLGGKVSVKSSPTGGGSMTVRFKEDGDIDKFLKAIEKIKG